MGRCPALHLLNPSGTRRPPANPGTFNLIRAMLPRPHPAVLFQPVPEGAILLHTEQEVYFELNSVGVEVWELLPPACTRIDEACARLAGKYPGVPADTLRADVIELLDGLSEQGLVVPADS